MLIRIICACGLILLVVALALSTMQARPVLAIIEVLLLMLSFPLLWYSRRIHNAWPFLAVASVVLSLLATGDDGTTLHIFANFHWFLKCSEALFAVACAAGAAFEAFRAWRLTQGRVPHP